MYAIPGIALYNAAAALFRANGNSRISMNIAILINVVTFFGTGAIAANAAGNTLAGVEVIPGSAIGICMLTVVGQCLGAGRKDQAVFYTKKLMIWAYLSFAAINIPFLLSSHWILSFLGLGADTINAAWAIVLTHGILGIVFWCMSFCLP